MRHQPDDARHRSDPGELRPAQRQQEPERRVLAADGRTVVQTQPLARCAAGGPATSYVRTADQDIYGPGVLARTAVRHERARRLDPVGELRPGSQGPRHALKINL